MVLLQANIYQNDRKRSLKSSKQCSHKAKHKKQQKRSARHEKQTYPEKTKLKVPKTLGCNVGSQSCKVDVRNDLCGIQFMNFDKIKVMTHMPQI